MSPLVDDGDLRWSSTRRRSTNTKRKRMSKKKMIPLVFNLRRRIASLERIFHSNFIARPIGGIEADNKLFFAELVLGYGKTPEQKEEERAKGVSTSVLTCPRLPCIIGPSGSKSGLYGCTSCGRIPGYVQHPKRGRFTKRY